MDNSTGPLSPASDRALRYLTPTSIMFLGCLIAFLSAMFTLSTSLNQPWLGLDLAADNEPGLLVRSVHPKADVDYIFTGDRILSIGSGEDGAAALVFIPTDLIEEPDGLASYAEMERFFERQGTISQQLSNAEIFVTVERGGLPEPFQVTPSPQDRPASSLPPQFWIQLVSGVVSFLIAMLVWSVRPSYAPAGMFALSGVALMLSALSAAIYSTRELALDEHLFSWLSITNHFGAIGFGLAMIALFLIYPKQLIRKRWLWLGVPLIALILIADIAHMSVGPVITHYLPVLFEMTAIVVLVVVQWRLSRRNPVDRASLQWVGLSVVIGAGAFVALVGVPQLLGLPPFLSQSYAFGFFILIYIGIALGIRRYRLFDLGTWAFQILFYSSAAVLVIMLDAVLIAGLQIAAAPSLGIALLTISFVWLPLRDTLWRRIYRKQIMPQDELFGAAMSVAFGPTRSERERSWHELLNRVYQPLEITRSDASVEEVEIKDGGTAMLLPYIAESPPLELRYAQAGRTLFGPPHVKLANQMIALVTRAEQTRDAYERGAIEERQRIATDLHDDVGAHLLTGLQLSDEKTRPLLRAALTEMRFILSGLTGEAATLYNVLADCRHEMTQRLEAADMASEWPLAPDDFDAIRLSNQQAKALISSIREIVTNAIRHSGATHLSCRFAIEDEVLHLSISDDGCGLPAEGLQLGNGLRNIEKRIASVGGELNTERLNPGTRMTIFLPLGDR